MVKFGFTRQVSCTKNATSSLLNASARLPIWRL